LKNGNVDIIKFLISIDGNTITKRVVEIMFYISCEYGHTSLLEYLLREYINFIGNNHYPFIQEIVRIAIKYYHLPIVKILVSYGLSITIDNGANVNWCDVSTLTQSRHRSKYDIVEYLSSKGVIHRTYICSKRNTLGLDKYLVM